MRGAGRSGGSLTVELVVLTPVVFVFVLSALALGRFELAREQVVSAARAGAEAASVVPSPGEAEPAAVNAVAPIIGDRSHTCAQLSVSTDTADFVPGGSVRVVVSCQIDFTDLLVPGFPGHAVVQETVSAPIDPFRSLP
jgi:Flp pilus assembly protein TadG